DRDIFMDMEIIALSKECVFLRDTKADEYSALE
ncbi:hypothetical protein NPIL_136441, partial [Nephila pilipes]